MDAGVCLSVFIVLYWCMCVYVCMRGLDGGSGFMRSDMRPRERIVRTCSCLYGDVCVCLYQYVCFSACVRVYVWVPFHNSAVSGVKVVLV